MANKSIKLVNMTSTEIFRLQVQSIYGKIRLDNQDSDGVQYMPTHLGGVPGQRDILTGKNIMRETNIK